MRTRLPDANAARNRSGPEFIKIGMRTGRASMLECRPVFHVSSVLPPDDGRTLREPIKNFWRNFPVPNSIQSPSRLLSAFGRRGLGATTLYPKIHIIGESRWTNRACCRPPLRLCGNAPGDDAGGYWRFVARRARFNMPFMAAPILASIMPTMRGMNRGFRVTRAPAIVHPDTQREVPGTHPGFLSASSRRSPSRLCCANGC